WNGGGTPAILDTGAGPAVELGTKFSSDVNGLISGLRFYKSPGDSGPHTVSLWSSNGTLLARATSTSETASGWQQVNFATPVAITAGTTYVASYRTTTGHFTMSVNYFNTPLTNGVLHTPVGGGVYLYGASGMPTQSYQNSNYWVDPVLTIPYTGLSPAIPLSPVAPGNWQIYDGQVSNTVQSAGGSASYTVDLQAGQLLSMAARAEAVNIGVSLYDPNGNRIVNNTTTVGNTFLLNSYTVTATGTWTITLTMPSGGPGSYWLEVAKNAGLEVSGVTQNSPQSLNSTFLPMPNGQGRYAWLGQATGTPGSNTDLYSVDLSAKVGGLVDIALATRGADLSGQSLEILAPDGVTLLARGTAWSPDGVSPATGLRIAGFTVPTAGVYLVRLTSSVTSPYQLVVNDSVLLDQPTSAQVLDFLIANNLTYQTSVANLVNTLAFADVFTSMSSDELLNALIRNGLVSGYNSVATLKAALPARGVDLASLRPDGILTALAYASGGSLMTLENTKLTAVEAKAQLELSFAADRVAFLDAFTTRGMLQLFDDSILSSASDPLQNIYAYSQPPTGNYAGIIPEYVMWQRDSAGATHTPTPEKAWAFLSQQPVGQRVVHMADFLEFPGYGGGVYGNTAGYVDPVDANGQVAEFYMIWMDQWAALAAAKMTAFWNAFKALGGQIDTVVVDIEIGLDHHSLIDFDQRVNPNVPATRTLWQAITSDPRWDAVKSELIAAGISAGDLTASAMANWDSKGTQVAIWNAVMEKRMADYRNQGFYAPLLAAFPNALLLNYNQYHRANTIPTGIFYAPTESSFTVGSVLGNAQSPSLYGWNGAPVTPSGTIQPPVPFEVSIKSISYVPTLDGNGQPTNVGTAVVRFFQPVTTLRVGDAMTVENRGGTWIDPAYTGSYQIAYVSPDGLTLHYQLQISNPSAPPASADLTIRQTAVRNAYVGLWRPYNAFVSDVNLIRTSYAASSLPILPWIASRDYLASAASAGYQYSGNDYSYYTEQILQVAASGVRNLLWWNYLQAVNPANSLVVSNALQEINSLLGYANRTALVSTGAGYADGYVLSGVDAGGQRVWRLTPDPTQSVTILSSSGNVSIQIGSKVVTIPSASIHTPANPVSNLGYWIVQTQGTSQLRGSVDQTLARIETALGPTLTPSSGVSPLAPTTFTLTMNPAFYLPGDQFVFGIDWDGNGTIDDTVTGGSGTIIAHTFVAAGTNSVRVTATRSGVVRPLGVSTTSIAVA
ncbi:MAG: DUF4082 domain-containing protein, partial [Pirellulales bacterium]